jgi:Ni/Co efflux regulator RcnB
MKRFLTGLAALSLLAAPAFAQGYDQNRDQNHGQMQSQGHDDRDHNAMPMRGPDQRDAHHDWRKGGHIARDDWGRGTTVDWHAHHLRRPPRGYEWREVDGNFVMAAVATGLIASVIMASH